MGFLADLVGKAVTGVKTLVTNAKVGKAAIANGFVLKETSQSQELITTPVVSGIDNKFLIGGGIGLLLLLFFFFSKSKR